MAFVDRAVEFPGRYTLTDENGVEFGIYTLTRNEGTVYEEGTLLNANNLLNEIYPVGSIYMSVNSTDPGVLFGGTWQQIKDTFLLSAGDNYAAGETGGAATVKLTSAESGNPAQTIQSTGMNTNITHTHPSPASSQLYLTANGNIAVNASTKRKFPDSGGNYHFVYTDEDNIVINEYSNTGSKNIEHKHNVTVGARSAQNAHENMPPYLTVYVWQRVS